MRVLVAVLLLASGCDPTSQKLSGADCKPRKLLHMQSCVGEDHSFQECLYFLRATGVPERSWCEGVSSASPVAGAPLGACRWDSAVTWTPVPCAKYNVHGAARCFACVVQDPEAGRTYVYAYDATCSQGIEQVTCNFDPVQAGAKLGAARL